MEGQQSAWWETGAQPENLRWLNVLDRKLWKLKFIPFKLLPGLTICGKCFSSLPLWNSQSNGKVTALSSFLIMIFSYSFNCWPTYCFWFGGWHKTLLLYWINIYYIDSQVWASGFISTRNEPSFFFFLLPKCWVSIFSPDSWLSVLSWKKALTVAEQCWAVAKESSEKHLDPPSQDGKCYFSKCWSLCLVS